MTRNFRLVTAFLFGVNALSVTAVESSNIPDPSTYPSLSTKQMGHVRHMINLANQLDGDFSLMGETDPVYHMSFHAYQFQFAFAQYALASTHYHYTPAHRDLYQKASARLIKRMIYKDVWDYWAHVSKFDLTDRTSSDVGEERLNLYTEDDWYGWIDPNIKKNIMYSGHLLQMVGLHATLFDDNRYDEPGSLTFRYAPVEYGQAPVEMKYNHERLTKVIYDQFVEDHFRGIECERNAVYAECNQHPILGLMSYDTKNGTDLSVKVREEFKKVMLKRDYIDPKTNTTMYFLKVKQDEVVPATYAWADGWNGHAQHVWDKEYIERIYPDQKERYIPSMLRGWPFENMGWTASFDFGWFALLASEVGDRETVQTMTDYADAHFEPTWRDGGYYYPTSSYYQYLFLRDWKGYIYNVGPATGNVLVGFARINPKDGLWKIYNQPWESSHFTQPYISDVDYLEASVTQAVYDDQSDALIVTLVPGPVANNKTTFTVHQLDPAKTYSLVRNGKVLGDINGQTGLALPNAAWQSDGSLLVSTDLESPQSFVLMATSVRLTAR